MASGYAARPTTPARASVGTLAAVSTYSRLADLPVAVDGYELEGLEQAVSSDFVRHTTVIRLCGGGEEGVGEDVTYEAEEQERFQAAGPVLDLTGRHTLASLSALFEGMPDYRRWGFESAALDLALAAGRAAAARGARPPPAAGELRRLDRARREAHRAGCGGSGSGQSRPALQARPDERLGRGARSRPRRARLRRRGRLQGGIHLA